MQALDIARYVGAGLALLFGAVQTAQLVWDYVPDELKAKWLDRCGGQLIHASVVLDLLASRCYARAEHYRGESAPPPPPETKSAR